jgi:hypothetical protein
LQFARPCTSPCVIEETRCASSSDGALARYWSKHFINYSSGLIYSIRQFEHAIHFKASVDDRRLRTQEPPKTTRWSVRRSSLVDRVNGGVKVLFCSFAL